MNEGKYQSDEEYREGLYKKFLEVIPDDLDDSFKQSLKKGKLQYANEFSLMTRLKRLTSDLSSYVSVGFLGLARNDQIDELTKIKDARNHLAHHGVDAKFKQISIEELSMWTGHLETIIVVALLKELEIPPLYITNIFDNQPNYS